MKASRYNIFVDQPGTGKTILYNSLYGSLTVWDPNEAPQVRLILANPPITEHGDSPIWAVLVDQKHLIDDNADELGLIKARKRAGMTDCNRLDVVIMPTLECNFACKYCYEVHRPSAMTDETEAAIKMWLTAQVPKYKLVLLHWYGGEPLLAYRRILSITRHALSVAESAKVMCNPHITTNGYLLNKSRIGELVTCGISDFQITLDGPPAAHDALRVLKDSSSTFARIFANVTDLARAHARVKVSLRVNFNHQNLHGIPLLLEMFPVDVRSHLRVVYEPIFGGCTLRAASNLPTTEISEALAAYYRLAADLGYDVVLGMSAVHTGKLVYCYAERENQCIINYNGDVCKCSVSTFEPSQRLGYLRNDGVLVEEKRWREWMATSLFDQRCYDCAYLPLCMGGCRQARLQGQGTGDACALVPTNASYLLKQIAFGGLPMILGKEAGM